MQKFVRKNYRQIRAASNLFENLSNDEKTILEVEKHSNALSHFFKKDELITIEKIFEEKVKVLKLKQRTNKDFFDFFFLLVIGSIGLAVFNFPLDVKVVTEIASITRIATAVSTAWKNEQLLGVISNYKYLLVILKEAQALLA